MLKSIERVVIKFITSGNVSWLAVMILGAIALCRLDPAGLKEVFLAFQPGICSLGWALGLVAVIFAKYALQWKDQAHQQEIDRIAEVRNIAIQESLKLPLESSGSRKSYEEPS